MKATTSETRRTRSKEAALALIQAMEADLREIQYRLSLDTQGPDEAISAEDNADLNTTRREICFLMRAATESAS